MTKYVLLVTICYPANHFNGISELVVVGGSYIMPLHVLYYWMISEVVSD